jgi:muconate cycloisomerase
MKIVEVRVRPLLLRLKKPYCWAQGQREHFEVVLVEVVTEDGLIGFGESNSAPDARAAAQAIRTITAQFVGQSAFDIARLCRDAWERYFVVGGVDPADGYANQLLAGVEMALWDVVGKALGQPVHRLLGGAIRDWVGYFGFVQGETTADLAAHASELAETGFDVIYMKVGRGLQADLENVAAVRRAIGDRRLRLDANEAWDPLTAVRVINALAKYQPEFIEQPTRRGSLDALAQVHRSVSVPIAADQTVITSDDVYEVCRRQAADVIVLGPHETGGLLGLKNAAIVAEAGGLNLCLHGTFESGISTCASNQIAATIPNLDDGNQIMQQLLEHDLVAAPTLALEGGRLGILDRPGLGFELDSDFVVHAARAFEIAYTS